MNSLFADSKPCILCGKLEQPVEGLVNYRGVDPCLGYLEGVTQACCGHGIADPYVVIAPGNPPGTFTPSLIDPESQIVLHNEEAFEFFASRGVGPHRKVFA